MANNPTGFISPITQALYGGPAQNSGTPQADLTGVNAWLGGQPGGNAPANMGAQQSAIGLAQQTAMGKGPSAAADLLKAQTAKTQSNANALASSAPGRAGVGEARRNATMVGANAGQELGANAAAARSKEQLGGESIFGQLAGEGRAQDIESAGLTQQGEMGNAGLELQQKQLNQQGAEFNSQMNQQMLQSLAGLGAGAALAFADGDVGANPNADFVEPPGKTNPPAMVSLREITGPDENPMLIMVNQQTGKVQRIAGTDLTPEEMACVQHAHGAGPLDASSPDRQAKPMNDGDLMSRPGEGTSGPMGFRSPQPMQPRQALAPTPRKTFADVVREAHAGLYTVPEGGHDPLGGGEFKSDENEPRTRRAASAAGNAVGGALFHDGDVGNTAGDSIGGSGRDFRPLGDQARGMVGGGGYYKPDDSAGITSTPSDNDVYYAQPGTDKNGDFVKATQMATAAGQGKVQPPRQPVYWDNPELQDSLRKQIPGGGGSSSNAGSPFLKALGGALAGYSNPKNLASLYGKHPVVQDYAGQASGVSSYQDGDIGAQLDAAHKAEMTMGSTSVTRNGETTVSREGDDEAPVSKSSPVAEQQKATGQLPSVSASSAYEMYPDRQTNSMQTDYAARPGSDPYAKLPQGLETSTTIGENSLTKNFIRGNPSQFSSFVPHDESGMPKHSAVQTKTSSLQAPEIPYDKRLHMKDYVHATYMDGDISDYQRGAEDGISELFNRTSIGKSLSGPVDAGNGRILMTQPDGRWAFQDKPVVPADDSPRIASKFSMTRQKSKPAQVPDGDIISATHPRQELTSKFAARPSKKRKSGKR